MNDDFVSREVLSEAFSVVGMATILVAISRPDSGDWARGVADGLVQLEESIKTIEERNAAKADQV